MQQPFGHYGGLSDFQSTAGTHFNLYGANDTSSLKDYGCGIDTVRQSVRRARAKAGKVAGAVHTSVAATYQDNVPSATQLEYWIAGLSHDRRSSGAAAHR